MNPSDFTIYPWSSLLQKSECETVARNIMVILTRTGNIFRDISFDEYKSERIKDGDYSDKEHSAFKSVIPFCKSAETAKTFSKSWNLNK